MHNHKMGEGEYVCKEEGGCQKIFPIPPSTLFFWNSRNRLEGQLMLFYTARIVGFPIPGKVANSQNCRFS